MANMGKNMPQKCHFIPEKRFMMTKNREYNDF